MISKCLLFFLLSWVANAFTSTFVPVIETTIYTTGYYFADYESPTTYIVTDGVTEIISAHLPDTTSTLYFYDVTTDIISLLTDFVDDNDFQTVTLEVHVPESITSTITYQTCAPGMYINRDDKNEGLVMLQGLEGTSYAVSTISNSTEFDYSFDSDALISSEFEPGFFSIFGYIAPKDAGWYEIRTNLDLSGELILEFSPENIVGELYPNGIFSIFFYADGTNDEGFTASYPVIISAEVRVEFTLEIYKNGQLLDLDDVFLRDDVQSESAYQYANGFLTSVLDDVCERQPITTTTSFFSGTDRNASFTTISDSLIDSIIVVVDIPYPTITTTFYHQPLLTTSTIGPNSEGEQAFSVVVDIPDITIITTVQWNNTFTSTRTNTAGFENSAAFTEIDYVFIPNNELLSDTATTASSSSSATMILNSNSTCITLGSSIIFSNSTSAQASPSNDENEISITSEYWSGSVTFTSFAMQGYPDGKSSEIEMVFFPLNNKTLSDNYDTYEASNGSSTINLDISADDSISTGTFVQAFQTIEIITITSCLEDKCFLVTKTTTFCPLTISTTAKNSKESVTYSIELESSYSSGSTLNQEYARSANSASSSESLANIFSDGNVVEQSENSGLQILKSINLIFGTFGLFLILQVIL